MFTFDNQEYDETKMSEKGKLYLSKIAAIGQKENAILLELEDLKVLREHYVGLIKEELPEPEKKSD